MPPVIVDAKICESGEGGIFLPLFGDWELGWPRPIKVIVYMIGLFWCFMGVAIISDVFMGAIETITSKKRLVIDPKTQKRRTKKVWNDTVANLTLMALGSSAPEILLSIIELIVNDFHSGELGPSTIVGSAAFNLLCISAVCISAIPDGELRKVQDINVFTVTAICSLWAYLWLLVILMGFTKDHVTIVEGLITFLFFFALVGVAYLADIGRLNFWGRRQRMDQRLWMELSKEEIAEMEMKIRQVHGQDLSEQQVLALLEYEFAPPKTRATYRVGATRSLLKGRQLPISGEPHWLQGKRISERLHPGTSSLHITDLGSSDRITSTNENAFVPYLQFATDRFTVLESQGILKIKVVRIGQPGCHLSVGYSTRDGTACADSDYMAQAGQLIFAPYEMEQDIDIVIIDDDDHEETEEFFVDLFSPDCISGDTKPKLGTFRTITVDIVDDDLPGTLSFQEEQISVQEQEEVRVVTMVVERKMGGSGKVTCKYESEDNTAVAGCDYDRVEGVLEFEPGQMSASFEVVIMPRGRYEGTESFRLVLSEPTGGAGFDITKDGGKACNICTVFIEASSAARDRVDQVMRKMKVNWDKMHLGHMRWKDQFLEACFVGGSLEDQREASAIDWIVHVVSCPWKLVFAIVPPAQYLDGWLCFICALLMIGGVTAIIGDMASLLGCSLGVSKPITAITFVALGTSLPDTFASKTAAVQDPCADNSLGNITGSNSVNVFLGLGLPWLIGALYWSAKGATPVWRSRYDSMLGPCPEGCFVVRSDGLGFNVGVFSGCAVCCIALLVARRLVVGGELGGKKVVAWSCSACLVSLWAIYIGLSAWYDIAVKDNS